MKKAIIAIIAVGLIWFLHSINPDFQTHKSTILPDTPTESEVWENLEYKSYFLASFTQAERGTMVSFGLCNYVRVVDEEWGDVLE